MPAISLSYNQQAISNTTDNKFKRVVEIISYTHDARNDVISLALELVHYERLTDNTYGFKYLPVFTTALTYTTNNLMQNSTGYQVTQVTDPAGVVTYILTDPDPAATPIDVPSSDVLSGYAYMLNLEITVATFEQVKKDQVRFFDERLKFFDTFRII